MSLALVPLATLRITIARQTRLDGLPAGGRLVGEAASCELDGRAQGTDIRASMAGTSSDWLTLLPDGSVRVDARLLLATSGGGLTVTYTGRAAAPPATGAAVYVSMGFETDDPAVGWLNSVAAVGKGLRDGSTLTYEIHRLE